MERRRIVAVAVGIVTVLASCGGAAPRGLELRQSTTAAPDVTDVTEVPDVATSASSSTVAPTPVATAASTTATAPTEATTIRFAPQSFVDPAANGVTAISVLVPSGWQATGSVQWLPFWSRLAFLQTRVADPVSGLTIDWLPIQDFLFFPAPAGFDVPIGGNYQGKAYVAPITDPADFVNQFWMPNDLADIQGAQLESVIEVPVIAQEFLTQFGGPGEAHAYRLRYSYLQNGQPWERDVSFALLFSGTSELVSWYGNFAHTESAPAGELDRSAGVISTVVASRISTPEWEANYRLVGQLFRQGLQQQMADTVAFGQLLAQYRAESARLQAEVVADRAASQDHQAEVFRETLGNVETYSDPVNDTLVQLPVDWNTYWVNENGEYLAVDQPGFDPNTLNDGTWQQLVKNG